MRRLLAAIIAVSLCLLSAYASLATDREDGGDTPEYEGYLVCIPSGKLAESHEQPLLRGASGSLEHVVNDVYLTESEVYANWMLSSGQAEYIEPNYVATLFDTEEGQPGDDWPGEMLCAGYAASMGLDGTGVRVAIIDSGLDASNINLTQARIAGGYDYISDSTAMTDDVYHGTKVAQIICGDDNGMGVTGIARGCEIVPLRCFSSTHSATVSELTLAVTEAVSVYHCDVINMSWGLANESETLHRAIRYACSKGAAAVAASGNVGSAFVPGSAVYPAYYDEVISVSSVDSTMTVAFDAIQNDGVTVCAPGRGISFVNANGAKISSSGTSFAAPCVSACAAIVKQYASVSGKDCLSLMKERSLDLGAAGFDPSYGYGLPRLDLLLRLSGSGLEDGIAYASLLRAGGGGTALLAAYDEQGRVTALSAASGEGGYCRARLELPEGCALCKAFFLNAEGVPLRACEVLGTG